MEYIDPQFKIPIYLDTNVLVDYIDNTYPLLNESIRFLQTCPFVELRSSHYVKFEFVEVRKIILFFMKVRGTPPSRSERYNIKQTWTLSGHDYSEYCDDIESQVMKELRIISEDLNIVFDDHVLHEKLIVPTSELVLRTKLSREDSLVLTSSVTPQKDQYLNYVVILTLDKQFYTTACTIKSNIIKLFSHPQAGVPQIMNAHNIQCKSGGTVIDLTKKGGNSKEQVHYIWRSVILELIKDKNKDNFTGYTYHFGKSGNSAKCVYFKLSPEQNTLKESNSVCIIPPSLTTQVIISVSKNGFYWNNGKIIDMLPYKLDDNKLSFMPINITSEQLEMIRQKGCMVFYFDD